MDKAKDKVKEIKDKVVNKVNSIADNLNNSKSNKQMLNMEQL